MSIGMDGVLGGVGGFGVCYWAPGSSLYDRLQGQPRIQEEKVNPWSKNEEELLRGLWPNYHRAAEELKRHPKSVHAKGLRMGLPKTRDGTYVKPSNWKNYKPRLRPKPKPMVLGSRPGRIMAMLGKW